MSEQPKEQLCAILVVDNSNNVKAGRILRTAENLIAHQSILEEVIKSLDDELRVRIFFLQFPS